ncbi:MAG: hypothetical protein ACXW2I_05830 [Burkholderiales bacterium]
MNPIVGSLFGIVIAFGTHAADLSGITNGEAASSLKQALTDGSIAAVAVRPR